ncbi:MAG: hypothetical protein OIN88_12085 [Candidatus Methanoperedens sp.]|nr:hypothetical protein [Candidatus Methanoperedens sp.]
MEDRPIKVLLIEDNPGDARLIREFLYEAGSWISCCSTSGFLTARG